MINIFIRKLETLIENEEKGIKETYFCFLKDQLFFIVNNLDDNEIKEKLCHIKGDFDDRYEIKEHETIYELIISLSHKYENLHRTNVDNMIRIYLNKLIKLIELIKYQNKNNYVIN